MNLFLITIFWISGFLIFWAMIGYPVSLLIINKILDPKPNKKVYTHVPTVTVMVVAHNEEKVIKNKLDNIIGLNYPKNKIKFLITSDNSTDKTNEIVSNFILENNEFDIKLYKAVERKGKTNAQNEAQKLVDTEFLVMTDANSRIEKNAIRELMASFSDKKISYVTGKLEYENTNVTDTSQSESLYWNLDLTIRSIESRLQTITAGNGALYAVRNERYIHFDPINSHDSEMPLYYGLAQQRAITNEDALVYEKAGETDSDEFGRKVRMSRAILSHIIPDIRILNFITYKWFSYFYLGHRTSRNLLWLTHILLFISSLLLVHVNNFYALLFLLQTLFYLIGIAGHFVNKKSKIIRIIYYYCLTISAQMIGVYRILTGQAKPFWEKAESTR